MPKLDSQVDPEELAEYKDYRRTVHKQLHKFQWFGPGILSDDDRVLHYFTWRAMRNWFFFPFSVALIIAGVYYLINRPLADVGYWAGIALLMLVPTGNNHIFFDKTLKVCYKRKRFVAGLIAIDYKRTPLNRIRVRLQKVNVRQSCSTKYTQECLVVHAVGIKLPRWVISPDDLLCCSGAIIRSELLVERTNEWLNMLEAPLDPRRLARQAAKEQAKAAKKNAKAESAHSKELKKMQSKGRLDVAELEELEKVGDSKMVTESTATPGGDLSGQDEAVGDDVV